MKLHEEVVTFTASLNILTLNYSAQLRLNYLIVSSNRGTVVRLIRKVELGKKKLDIFVAQLWR